MDSNFNVIQQLLQERADYQVAVSPALENIFADIDKEYDETYRKFEAWKENRRCVYLQGLDGDRRAAYESVAAVLRTDGLTAVVVGRYDQTSRKRLEKEYGEELHHRVLFIGRIPQMKIPQYVKQCYTTLVFYKNISPNNYYCEANRFYQSVLMGLPVVVGSNPPMKEIVEKYGFGVSIDDDGGDVQKIIDGIHTIEDRYDVYRKNIEKNKENLLWKNQKTYIKEMMDFLLS